ncbi:MAG TPA: HAD family phosphatase [Sphingomonas sp.]|jgi:membrane protein
MPKAVLFDLDGTLVDSNTFHVDVWDQVFREAGYPVPRDVIGGQIGKGGDQLVPALLPHLDAGISEQLEHRHGVLFKQLFLDRVRPFPGAAALVERVHASGAKVVLASSASAEELDHYGKLLGIEHLVAARTTSDDVSATKPAPDIFATACQKVGVDPADAVVIGDTPYDIEGATAAGIRTVAVRSGGFSNDTLADAIATYDDVGALLADFERSPLAD